MKKVISISLLLAVCFSASAAYAEMYKWTDKNGETHYTQTPPPSDAVGKNIEADIKLSTGKIGNITTPTALPTAEKKLESTDASKKAGEQSLENHKKFCESQKMALTSLTEHSLIKWKDDKGERFLTADEKSQKRTEVEKNLADMCTPAMFEKMQAADENNKNKQPVGSALSKPPNNSGNFNTSEASAPKSTLTTNSITPSAN